MEPTEKNIFDLFEKHPDFFRLGVSYHYPVCESLFVKYYSKFSHQRLYANKNVYFTKEFIKKHETLLSFDDLSGCETVEWSMELFEAYKGKWNYNRLFRNAKFPLTPEFIDKYAELLDWKNISLGLGKFGTPNFMFSEPMIGRYEKYWNWKGLSVNSNIKWTVALLKSYENKLDWNELSRNRYLPWSLELIECFKDKWNWKALTSFPNDAGRPVALEYQWNLSKENKELPFFVYIKQLNKKEKSSKFFEGEAWTIEMIRRNKFKLNFESLSMNPHLPWSPTLLLKYDDEWDWIKLTFFNKEAWLKGIAPFLNDDLVEQLLEKIVEKEQWWD